MKLRILVFGMLIVGLALVPATAYAKGAKDVTISGPGLERPLRLGGADGSSLSLDRLAQATGLYAAAFRQTPSPLAQQRPVGKLGPHYGATYTLYAPSEQRVVVRQRLYPLAEAGFLTYTLPGQKVFGREVVSGWYRSDPVAGANLLVALGVPIRGASVVPVAATPPPITPSPVDASPRLTG